MVNTPRDYYVQLHGKTGLKDKLTHAGLVGGVNMSMSTLEDLYGIKVPYYVRVNFNAVVKLVDAIDGITLYNDQTRSFSCWTDRDCVFKPGDNNVKGKCALAFARERHAYTEGDRHRGENQEQVIQKIIEKVTEREIEKEVDINTRHLKLYNNFLDVLEGSFKNPAEYMYLGMPDYDKLKKMVDILEKSQKGQRLAKGLDKEIENSNVQSRAEAIQQAYESKVGDK